MLCCAVQGVGSQAFTIFAELVGEELGVLLLDPSQQFAEEAAAEALLRRAGYSSWRIASSEEVNLRRGQSPQQWAASGWEACLGMPFADLRQQLAPERLDGMRRRYVERAERLAQQFVTPEGVAEQYTMLWVVAFK